MSGHNKWSQIKHKKGATDAKRSASFTRVANMIALAAREGGGDINTNYRLKIAVEQAKSVSMPKDNIERAIKRGTGELGGERIEAVIYEAYGPAGIGFLIEGATDNKNRTNASVKTVLNKAGAKMATSGSVQFQFEQVGEIIAEPKGDEDEAQLTVIEVGAQDYSVDDGLFSIITPPTQLMQIRQSLQEAGFDIKDANLIWQAKSTQVVSSAKDIEAIDKLFENLAQLDDVTGVFYNATIEGTGI